MKIVLTNDDGIDAPGLRALADSAHPQAELLVVAPATPVSECSHQVTTQKPIRVDEVAPRRFAVCGTPAILVPYPAAADRHQDANAAAAAQLGAAVIVWQHPPSEPALERSLWRLLGPRLRGTAANCDPLVAMGAAMAQLAVRDADRQVAALLLSLQAQRSASS